MLREGTTFCFNSSVIQDMTQASSGGKNQNLEPQRLKAVKSNHERKYRNPEGASQNDLS
jgi:hypothetical protein